jgi:hypothetical protein
MLACRFAVPGITVGDHILGNAVFKKHWDHTITTLRTL